MRGAGRDRGSQRQGEVSSTGAVIQVGSPGMEQLCTHLCAGRASAMCSRPDTVGCPGVWRGMAGGVRVE